MDVLKDHEIIFQKKFQPSFSLLFYFTMGFSIIGIIIFIDYYGLRSVTSYWSKFNLELLLFNFLLIWGTYFLFSNGLNLIEGDYIIYTDGILLPKKIVDFRSHAIFISYSNISDVEFEFYGLNCILVLQTNKRIIIHFDDGQEAYIHLLQIFINKFSNKTFPDIQLLKDFSKAKSKRERMEIMKRIMAQYQSSSEPAIKNA
jgi:hypothetical protein